MYKCFRFKKLVRLLVCDAVIIMFAFIITFAGHNRWLVSSDSEEKIFLPVIMYHSIVDDSSRISDYSVTPEIVENDLKYLKEHGYNTVFTEDVINYVNGGSLPDNPIIITADDGFYNNEAYLLPLLEKYDMKAVISVVGYYTEVTAAADPHVPEYS
ncbi:MAG: polysaccharide deacetylase family protein, partial [Porcipelethomonas sp.]